MKAIPRTLQSSTDRRSGPVAKSVYNYRQRYIVLVKPGPGLDRKVRAESLADQ